MQVMQINLFLLLFKVGRFVFCLVSFTVAVILGTILLGRGAFISCSHTHTVYIRWLFSVRLGCYKIHI